MSFVKEILRRASQPSGKTGIVAAITICLTFLGIGDSPELVSNIAGIVAGICSVALIIMDQKK